MSRRMLFAGPWVGEFGHEIANWVPFVRAKSRSFDRTIVAAPDRDEHLYTDFCHEFIPIAGVQGHAVWQGKSSPSPEAWARMTELMSVNSDAVHLSPKAEWPGLGKAEKEWFKYGEQDPNALAEVVVFLRPPKPLSAGRGDPLRKSYPEPMAAELVRRLADSRRVACAGGPDNRIHQGASDMRGMGLRSLCAVLRSAKCACGPSSGPLHLAAACGCPQVVWCSHVKGPSIRRRYELPPPAGWNPFGAKVEWLGDKDPDATAVFEAVERMVGG